MCVLEIRRLAELDAHKDIRMAMLVDLAMLDHRRARWLYVVFRESRASFVLP